MKIVIDEVNNRAIQNFLRWQGPVKVTIDGEKYAVKHAHLMPSPSDTMVEFTLEKVVRATQKEEKKMLNVDKYRGEIEKRQGWAEKEKITKPVHFIVDEIVRSKGLPYMNGNQLVDWLFSKYEPPLLENGDGLKPGDWIMVRDYDDDSWNKMKFVFYYDKAFFVLDDNGCNGHFDTNGMNVTGWAQARLPEEGE